jgi:hypothetical protein
MGEKIHLTSEKMHLTGENDHLTGKNNHLTDPEMHLTGMEMRLTDFYHKNERESEHGIHPKTFDIVENEKYDVKIILILFVDCVPWSAL